MMLIVYVRVSTNDQNPALQRNALECAGCELAFEIKNYGKTSGGWLLKALGKGEHLTRPGYRVAAETECGVTC